MYIIMMHKNLRALSERGSLKEGKKCALEGRRKRSNRDDREPRGTNGERLEQSGYNPRPGRKRLRNIQSNVEHNEAYQLRDAVSGEIA